MKKWAFDYKAAGKYEDVILAEHPEGWGAGGFVHVDGWPVSISTFDHLLATGRCPWLRLELCWDDQHAFNDRHIKIVQNNAELCRPLLKKYPGTQIYIAPVTEHTIDRAQWNKYATVTDNVLRGLRYELVNVPLDRGFVHDSLINEIHGSHALRGNRTAHSYDGENMVDSDVEADRKRLANCEYRMVWNCQNNGNRVLVERDKNGKPIKIPRDKRKFYLSAGNQYDSHVYQTRERGDVKIPKDWILKSHSDQHFMPPKGRDCKPVIITPKNEKYKEIVFKAKNGQVVNVAPYTDTYNEKPSGKLLGHRYYCTDWGYLIAEKAKRICGDPVVQIWVNGKRVGRCNLGFRGGSFR